MANEEGGEELRDQTGRLLGPRAQQTRERLLEATRDLLSTHSLRDLAVAEIARKVQTSPATFYQYFKDVEDAVLCLAERASAEMPAMLETIGGSWDGEEGLEKARAIADAFIRHWDEHQAVLRVRNLASDEGDPRFGNVRREAMSPLIASLAERIAANDDALHPFAAAAAMAAILERLAAYHRELEIFGVTREDLIDSTARILHRTLTGS